MNGARLVLLVTRFPVLLNLCDTTATLPRHPSSLISVSVLALLKTPAARVWAEGSLPGVAEQLLRPDEIGSTAVELLLHTLPLGAEQTLMDREVVGVGEPRQWVSRIEY